MEKSTEETKQTAVDILTAVRSIYPQLAEVSKKTDFEITITGNKKGVYLEFSVDWDPTEDEAKRRPLTEAKRRPLTEAKPGREDEVKVEDVTEGVRIEDEEMQSTD